MIDKKLKAVVQGGVDNYLGKQPQVQAPRKWQSSPDKPATELAYITEAEKDLILKANIHGGLEGGPNMGPSGIMSLDSFGDVGGAGASGGDTSAGGGANEGAGFSGKGGGESPADFSARVAKETANLQNAENIQARDLGYNARQDIVNRTYGPLQKYTGERGFLGNLFRGANKYGYTDTYTSGPNEGQVKPGYFGRAIGGLGSLLTGMPFVGGALGSMYDYGKGIFGPKQRDMSQFNKLGLGGVNPATYDFDPNAQINQDVDTTGYSRFSNASLGQPNINNLESLIAASQGIDTSMYGADQDIYGVENARGLFRPSQQSTDFNTKYSPDGITNYGFDEQPDGIMGLEADLGLPSNDLMADVSANDLKAIGKYAPNQNIPDIRMFEPSLNPTLTDKEIKGILDGTITEPTGQFARNGGIMGYGRG